MGATESKQIVQQFIDDLAGGNVDAVTAAFADDASWWLPGTLPVSGTYKGKQEIFEGFFATAQSYFEPESLSIHVKSMIAEDDAVAVEWVAKARSAQGTPYENYYHVRFDLKDGKIQEVREYVDTLYAKDTVFG